MCLFRAGQKNQRARDHRPRALNTGTGFKYQVDNSLFGPAYARSKRSRFITLLHAATKSFTNASFESLLA
jgi:hypothetical protein